MTTTYTQLQGSSSKQQLWPAGCLLGRDRRARHPEEADTGMLPNSPLPKLTTATTGMGRRSAPGARGAKGCGHLNYSPAQLQPAAGAAAAEPRAPPPRVLLPTSPLQKGNELSETSEPGARRPDGMTTYLRFRNARATRSARSCPYCTYGWLRIFEDTDCTGTVLHFY